MSSRANTSTSEESNIAFESAKKECIKLHDALVRYNVDSKDKEALNVLFAHTYYLHAVVSRELEEVSREEKRNAKSW